MNYFTNIIGKGILYPFNLQTNSEGKTGIYPVDGSPDLIKENISALLYYMVGFRIRQEPFGTRLWECIEEPNTQALSFLIRDFLVSAISTYEDRVTITSVDVSRADCKINILISYHINNTDTSQYIGITYDLSNNTL